MFKRKFYREFEFIDNLILTEDKTEYENFDGLIVVIYNKFEVINFLKGYKKETNVLVCVFNEQLFERLTFLEEFNGVGLLDGSKTRRELVADLRSNLKKALNFKQGVKESFSDSAVVENQLHVFLKDWIVSSAS
ncbi:hypothetical protein [Flavobacterium poyangense]|uniref:hypothetical protein n=1 Tax=Flavobacterium poyangense TaxID=2204302 RepID=UPI00142054F8|nr:hypothetical protein [Flavobacterium sp. JXAS1]